MKRKIRKSIGLFVVLLIAALFGGRELLPETKAPATVDGILSVAFIDVGQGDSSLITLPGGTIVLIDAGVAEAGDTVADYIEQNGHDSIDYLICTHPHADHIGGMQTIIEQFDIGQVYMPKAYHDSYTYEKLLNAISQKGLQIHTAKAGVSFSPEEGVTMDFVAPVNEEYDDVNNYSAVLRLTYGDNAFLFTGDAEKLSESEMLESGAELSADVLKVGHHGSSTSTSQSFLNAVNPTWAVISLGADNEYGHPHIETMASLQYRRSVKHILRTDEVGTVVLLSDGRNIWQKEEN